MEASPPEFALHWASQLGAVPLSLRRLRGGINNRVYRCNQGHKKWVIKGYGPARTGFSDRMQAEVDFLRFAAEAAPGFTPTLIKSDPERRCVVLEHLQGEAYPESESPSHADVAEAVEFFRQLNAVPRLARSSIRLEAAEGYLSLREHLSNVRERYERMSYINLDSELRPHVETLLNQLDRELAQTEKHINRLIDGGIVANTIDPNERCVSPSDFGFHNAIRTSKGINFIDFEFAGWDDPAKAIEDFILQPRVPIASNQSPLLEAFPPETHTSLIPRCKAMGSILKLKWICIVLGVLQPDRLEEILSMMPEKTSENLIRDRIEKARRYLGRIH
jgi:hypothetical protein